MATSWALPAAVLGAIFLIREAKATVPGLVAEPLGAAVEGAKAAGSDLLDAAAGSGAYYGQMFFEGIAAAGRLEALEEAITTSERLSAEQMAVGATNFGSIDGSIGVFTGEWRAVPGTADRCSVDFWTPSGKASRFFTGGYCRRARAAGLIL